MKKLSLAFMFFLMTTPVFSQMIGAPAGNHHTHGMGMMGEHMDDMMQACLSNAEKLGLTEQQISKLNPVHREMMKKQARFKADLKIAEIELMEIMEVKDFDIEKATAASRKITDIKAAHHADMLKSMKEVRSTLTEDQFQKLKKIKMSGKTSRSKPKEHKHPKPAEKK